MKKSKDLLAKRNFRGVGVDVGNGHPLSAGKPHASGNDAVQMRIPSQVVRECLYGGDHADADVVVIDSGGHELVDGFVAGAGELGEELAAEEEIWAEHFGNGKSPNGMADVFQKLLLEKSCEGGGSFGIA